MFGRNIYLCSVLFRSAVHFFSNPVCMYRIVCPLLFLLTFLTACQRPVAEVPEAANAIYYWRSELTLSTEEQAFLKDHDIRKAYLHLFDVVRRNGQLQPQTTLEVRDTFPPEVDIIPIVFMAPDVMKDTTGLAELPRLIAHRVQQMMEQNEMQAPRELQIDFDWTKRNAKVYFMFIERLKEAIQQEGMQRLSATIRLHQLSMPAPPVDYGALMVYNVGRLQDPDEKCSILTTEAVRPYLQHLKDYPLPLCTALPVYRWDLLFHDGNFRCILRGMDLQDTTLFRQLDATHYQALQYQIIPPNAVTQYSEGRIYPSDIVRHESVSAKTLHEVLQMLRDRRPSMTQQLILYHLDQQQLKDYNPDEIQELYSDR